MKKGICVVLVALLATSTVWAASTASYDEMKEIKKAQRARREAEKAGTVARPESKWSKFWKNEGERSGLGLTKSSAGSVFSRMNPTPFFQKQKEQYEARKAAAGK